MNIFFKTDHKEGLLIKYDSNKWPDTSFESFKEGQWDIIEIKKNDADHVLVIKDKQMELLVRFDFGSLSYQLLQISTNDSEKQTVIDKAPQREINASLLFYPKSKRLLAREAMTYTSNEWENINELESYDNIIEQERIKEEEKHAIDEQLEIWNMSIEAERIRLVDTPFNCIGINEVRSTSADFQIDEFIEASNDESVSGIVADTLNMPVRSNDDGSFDLTLAQLKRIADSGKLVISEIGSCEVTVGCENSWQANSFKKEHKSEYWLNYDYDEYDETVELTLSRIKSIDHIEKFIKDVNNALEFNSEVKERGVKCCDVSLKAYRKESKEERGNRIERLKGKEFFLVDGGKKISIGTLAKKGNNFQNLRIAFPQGKKESDVDTKKIFEYLTKLKHAGNVSLVLKPDLEKEKKLLDREHDAIEKVKNGRNLINPRLKDFIFNSAHARPTVLFEHVDIKSTPEYEECIKTMLLNLNDSQKEAVVKAIYAEDLCLLQGPPGTGKTTVIAEMLWQLIRKNQNSRIMLTSQSNLAIDNALNRLLGEFVTQSGRDMQRYRTLVKPLRIADSEVLSEEGMRFTVDRIDAWVEKAEGNDNVVADWLRNIAKRVDNLTYTLSEARPQLLKVLRQWKSDLEHPDAQLRASFAKAYKDSWNIMGMTCGKVDSSDFKNNGGTKGFDIIIMDEASKCTPPELLMPLCYGKKAIVIGDHRQLPPVIYEEDFREDLLSLCNERANELAKKLKEYELKTSLFKKLITNKKLSDSIWAAFKVQYRMHKQINDVIAQFYTDIGGLVCGLDITKQDSADFSDRESRYHGLSYPGILKPNVHTIWIDVPNGVEKGGGGESWENQQEVDAIGKLLQIINKAAGYRDYIGFWKNYRNRERSVTESQLGIISFYAKQKQKLASKLQSLKDKGLVDSACFNARVDTVDNFQGQERGIVIVSTVRTIKEGFTKQPERLNVALSRARRLLIIVGNSKFFSSVNVEGHYIYKNVIDQIKANHGFIDVSELDKYTE